MKTKQFVSVGQKQSINIEFKNISCKIGGNEILHSVSGKFFSGQLIGILGASGSGKTTLLDILTGQLQSGISGDILINNQPRDMKKFRKMFAYLMQDDLLQPLLTLQESISAAANLKLGQEYTDKQKLSVIHDVLSLIGLDNSLDLRVENLSGGQRKRLTIALELVNNPPVIFLDEPTTGLDNFAVKNCVDMLRNLTNHGRTVICTIHQPSDSIFKLFDLVYFLSKGYCIYNGSVDAMVPFLANSGFQCPISYSPADYVIETVHFKETNTIILSEDIRNGKLIKNGNAGCQVTILLHRRFLQLRRNKIAIFLDVVHHLLCGIFLGCLFYNVGNSGVNSYNNLKLYFATVVYVMYTRMIAPTILFPGEIKIFLREYLNGWYSLKAFFAALTVSVLPLMITSTISYLLIVYPLSGQVLELNRFIWFLSITLLMALTADAFGYAVGSMLSPLNGVTVASVVALPLTLVCIYNVGHAHLASDFSKSIIGVSFPYQAWVAMSVAMLHDRGEFECEEIFCYFGTPQFLLKSMGMEGRSHYVATLILFLFFIIFKCLSYASLRFRASQHYALISRKLKPLLKVFHCVQK